MTVFPWRLLAVWVGMALTLTARAQPSSQPAPILTVDDAVRLAIANNPSLRAAGLQARSAEHGKRSARALANPEITFTPAITPGGSDEELLIRQPLEANGARSARAAIAEARLRGTRAAAIITLRDIVFETEVAYHGLARARAQRSLAEENLKAAEEFDRITSRQVEVGSRPGIDRTQTGIEAARARRQHIQAQMDVSIAEAALNTALGRPPDSNISALTPLDSEVEAADNAASLKQVMSFRADIVAEEAERDAFWGEASLARADGRPDIVPQFRAGSLTRGISETGFGVGISIPLGDYGGRRARIRQAEESARAQESRITARRNRIALEVAEAVARLKAADAVLKSYSDDTLASARRLLDASRIGFQAGQTSVIALLEAQRTWRAVQAEHTDALVERALAASALRRATAAVPAEWLPAPDDWRTNP